MENGYIQLPYGFIPDQNEDEKIYFDLPLNYKKNLLFDKLPYVAQLNNPAIDNVVKGKQNDNLSIQKFLLATDLLQDTIQDNLDMIVRMVSLTMQVLDVHLIQNFPRLCIN